MSKETEVKCIKNVIEFIESDIYFIEEKLPKMNREKSEGRKEWHEGYLTAMREVKNKLGQLDEPEVLSQEWIDNHTDKFVSSFDLRFVSTKDLQNLLVPKQEEVKIESLWAEDIEEAKENGMTLFKTMNWMGIDSDEKEKQDLFARAWLDGYQIEEEQKYYVVKREGLDGVHYYFTTFDDEMNGLFTLPNDKERAYKFDDKEKAQAIANYTDSKVEELEE